MKLKINGEYAEVDFWSFLKCNFFTSIVISVISFFALMVIFFIIGVTIA